MKTFKIFHDGKEGKITIDGLAMPLTCVTKIKVVELKIGSHVKVENKDMSFWYKIKGQHPYLKLENGELIALKNQDLIEYVWNLNKDKKLELYGHTNEFKNNWCD